jgi:hypothetical protein
MDEIVSLLVRSIGSRLTIHFPTTSIHQLHVARKTRLCHSARRSEKPSEGVREERRDINLHMTSSVKGVFIHFYGRPA